MYHGMSNVGIYHVGVSIVGTSCVCGFIVGIYHVGVSTVEIYHVGVSIVGISCVWVFCMNLPCGCLLCWHVYLVHQCTIECSMGCSPH